MHDRDSDTNRTCSSQLKSHGVDLCHAPFPPTPPPSPIVHAAAIAESELLGIHYCCRSMKGDGFGRISLPIEWLVGPPAPLCGFASVMVMQLFCYLGVVCNVCLCVNCGSLGCLALTRVPICTSLRWWAVPNVVNCEETCFRMVQDGVLCA